MRTYQTQIENQPFVYENLTTTKTAVVKTFANQKLISVNKYGVIDVNEVYQKIIANQPIDISYGYVHNFSVKELKKQYDLSENDAVSLVKFKAKNAFFETEKTIDFSRVKFVGGPILVIVFFQMATYHFTAQNLKKGM
ncbi:MAG: hypothetical protein HYU68_03790 [Bacteroidetes bacterium]|nr:hypothetical protein [Bacteroidota bacterium]